MANYETLKSAIQQVVKTNGNNEITGALLQQSLLAMINSLGSGYQFVGVAKPATNPGTPDQKIFYIANGKGIYTNFGGISITENEVVILYYDADWHKLLTGIASQADKKTMVSITYAELVALRDNGELIAGMQYRITDYVTTTAQKNTRSAGHQFDIIVIADNNNTLNEVARAVKYEGDAYFANSDLNAWKIWYCLDNDTNRFAWANSTNGKGVIYRMIDEFNNDVPYDFKNIQFRYEYWGSAYFYYYYTFASDNVETNTDNSLSISNGCYNNNISEYILNGKRTLNSITFIGGNCYNNSFNSNCNYNIFGNSCSSNKFGAWTSTNIFGNNCDDNVFGNGCHHNTFGTNCISNIFADNCDHNTFGDNCYGNVFGIYCSNIFLWNNTYSNSFGNYCSNIKFASDIYMSKKYSHYNRNHFGDGCQYIVFTGAATASSKQQVRNYNFAQGLQGTDSAYLTIDGVRNRAYETKVAKNSSGEVKVYCEADLIQ